MKVSNLIEKTLNDKNINTSFYIFLILHIVLWSIVPGFSRISMDTSGDAIEAFTWGQEWQWGYYKHPPLFAWTAALWLKTFGFSHFSFFLLSLVNISIAFVAIFYLAKEYLPKREAFLSVLLLEFIVFYTFSDIKFNANSILISLVPLVALFAYYAIVRKKIYYWIMLGFFSALAILGKYFAGVILLSIFLSFVFSKEGRSSFLGMGPYIALTVFFVVLTPHIIWLFNNDFMPLIYPSKHIAINSIRARIEQPLLFTKSYILFCLPLILVYYFSTWDKKLYKSFYIVKDSSFKSIFLLSMFVFPVIITIFIGISFGVKLSTRWMAPCFSFLGVLLLSNFGQRVNISQAKRILIFSFSFLIIVPIMHFVLFYTKPTMLDIYTFPSEEIARQIENKWDEETGKTLQIVTGSEYLAHVISYYSKSNPSHFIEYNFKISPWINDKKIQEQGLAVVCSDNDQECTDNARKMFGKIKFKEIVILPKKYYLNYSKEVKIYYYFFMPNND